ncbi:hypothetical protein NMG60_11018731 [Bertholletia excelsa]
MVKSTERGASIPPFLLKCYEMVDDQSTDTLISWSSAGDSFIILDVTEFESELLPKYFKHRNFSSFIRQLNIYGFRKIDTDHWEFASDGFIKGQKQLLKNIYRRKQTPSTVQRKSSQQDIGVESLEEDKSLGLWKEVESLKTDKNVLMQELVKLRQHQQNSRSKLLVVGEQLEGMEKNQQQMLSFMVMAMQNSEFLVQLLHPKESNWRMAEAGKNVLEEVTDDHESMPSDGLIVRYQPPLDQSPKPLSMPASDSEKPFDLDLFSDEVKDLFMNIDFSGSVDEPHWPIVLPDLPDDSILEQLLLSSPLPESKEDDDSDTAELEDFGMRTESTPCGPQLEVSDNFELVADPLDKQKHPKVEKMLCGCQLDKNQNMKILTEQMGLLTSECSQKHQNSL